MDVGWSAFGVGIIAILWGLISYFGDESFDEGIVDTYSKKFIILDQARLIKHRHLGIIIQGTLFVFIGILQTFHRSNTVSIALVIISTIFMTGGHLYQRRKFLIRKN
ncbi:hypothetical protein [Alkaliphilus peptidifermentans]|uniref:DUF3784 domain-containing protein n=1 Tax=Alkaliphilus peptidifermentans DSM 18978 TaxID=1120976 RepID=A0A1G5GX22_9FIRM|nr:hypothetical protein [Alkaliphilus peptidifermentans]SCY56152.1 hypothetical protein SAMN03080606_01818 [Alkaliphilus peptidifermentans DSM 18978]